LKEQHEHFIPWNAIVTNLFFLAAIAQKAGSSKLTRISTKASKH